MIIPGATPASASGERTVGQEGGSLEGVGALCIQGNSKRQLTETARCRRSRKSGKN